MKNWVPPPTLIIQPDALLVPGRVGYVPAQDIDSAVAVLPWMAFVIGHSPKRYVSGRLDRQFGFAGRRTPGATMTGPDVDAVFVARWDLSHLTLDELESLAVAVDAQLNAGPGTQRPATVAEQRALRLFESGSPRP